jgi:hypothetical protein
VEEWEDPALRDYCMDLWGYSISGLDLVDDGLGL